MIRVDCIRTERIFRPLECPRGCNEFSVTAIHHCLLLVVDIAVRAGGLTQTETAEAMGVSQKVVRDSERSATAKVGRKMRRLGMVAPHG